MLRKFALGVALVAALGLTASAGTASAQATPQTVSITETGSGPDQSPCTGLTGTNTYTVTDFFRFVAGADGTSHLELYQTLDYRSDWSDGTYLISHSSYHEEFEAQSDVDQVDTFTQQDRGTLYSLDGQVIGHQTVFTQGHFTVHDGIPVTSPEQFRVTCR